MTLEVPQGGQEREGLAGIFLIQLTETEVYHIIACLEFYAEKMRMSPRRALQLHAIEYEELSERLDLEWAEKCCPEPDLIAEVVWKETDQPC